MKQALVLSCVFLLCVSALAQSDRIAVSFIGVNAYGNNLYLDNVSIGTQYTTDIGIVSVRNIAKDTSYIIGSSNFRTAPKIAIVNVGRTDINTSFNVTFMTVGGTYSSTKQVASLAKGAVAEVEFDSLLITVSTGMNYRVYSSLFGDQNRSNDTLKQYSMFLPGVQRNILFEEWTSSTCGPCATNNPTVDAFIAANFAMIVPVKYHVGWPSPGTDPMYHFNPTQSYDRRYYYGVNAVPHVVVDGLIHPSYPYTTPTSLPNAWNARVSIGAPLTVTVTDTRIGDSIRANVVVNVISQLRAGTYKLRVEGIEHHIAYPSPPGPNGESHFYDVFRASYPNSTGSSIPLTPGVNNFTFTYKIASPAIMDSMYTIAFVQNDATREVMNCGKGITVQTSLQGIPVAATSNNDAKDVCIVATDESTNRRASLSQSDTPTLLGTFGYEMFELTFPPAGWRLGNPNADLTFEGSGRANGISFGGSSCVKMDFYNYSNLGRVDSLNSPVYSGLLASDTLKFDWAYAPYATSGYDDRLIVKISTNGGTTFDSTIFDRAGVALGTVGVSTSEFTPTSPSQWRTFAYPLKNFLTSVNGGQSLPSTFALSQNYPNPFNPATTITYQLPADNLVTLSVYDVLGKEVAMLVNERKEAGTHQVSFNGLNFSSGVYFYRLAAGPFVDIKKMVIMK